MRCGRRTETAAPSAWRSPTYQSFIPAKVASDVFRQQLRCCRRADLVPYVGVLKRHRPDDRFSVQYCLDGFSLALQFWLTASNRIRLPGLVRELDALVTGANGRFHLAKDSTLSPATFARYLRNPRLQQFLTLKRDLDPNGLLASDLWRRVLAPAADR